MHGAFNLRDEAVQHLADSTCTTLTLSLCKRITDQALISIGTLVQLRKLNLSESLITDEGLLSLGQLSRLTSINLIECDQLSSLGVQRLFELLPQIEKVAVSGKILPKKIACFAPLKSLQELHISHCHQLTRGDAIALGKLHTLRVLSIHAFTQLTDKDLLYFSTLTNLETLKFIKTSEITKESLKGLRSLIENLPKLRFLSIPQEVIADRGLRRLRKEFPKVEIDTNT